MRFRHRRLPSNISDAPATLAQNIGMTAIDFVAKRPEKGLGWICLKPGIPAPTGTAQELWKAVHYLSAGADEQLSSINLYGQRECYSKRLLQA